MKIGLMLFRFGILGFLFAPGVLLEEPLKSLLAQDHSALPTYLLLYGLPVLVGFTIIMMTEEGFRSPLPLIARLINILSLVTLAWLILWCLLWPGLATHSPNPLDPFVKNILTVSLAGVVVGAACYGWAWRANNLPKKTAWFLITIGWNISAMAFLNLHLDPAMGHLKGPGFGGLLVMAGVSMILKEL